MAMRIVNITEDTAGVGLPSKLTIWQVLTLCNLVDQVLELCSVQGALFWREDDGENTRRWQEQAKKTVMARNAAVMGIETWDYDSTFTALKGQLDMLRRLPIGKNGGKDALVTAGEMILARAGIEGA